MFPCRLGATPVPLLGDLAQPWPPFHVPSVDWRALPDLLSLAFALTIVALAQSISIAKAVATRSGQRIDANREFVGQGLSNEQIADRMGLPSTSAVYQSLKRSNATTPMSTERLDLEEAIRLRHAGLSHAEIAGLLGASVSVVSNALSRAGVVERRRKD